MGGVAWNGVERRLTSAKFRGHLCGHFGKEGRSKSSLPNEALDKIFDTK